MATTVLIFNGAVDGNKKRQHSRIDKITYDGATEITKLYYTKGSIWEFTGINSAVFAQLKKANDSILDSEDGFLNGDWDYFVEIRLFTNFKTVSLIKGTDTDKKFLAKVIASKEGTTNGKT